MELSNKSSREHSKCVMSCEAIGKSSVHALSQLSQAKSSCARVFWLVVFVVTVSGCAYQVYSFLYVYLQYQVLIDLKYQRVMALDFPAVTVCNLNGITLNHIDCVNKSLTWDQCHPIPRQTGSGQMGGSGGYGGGSGGLPLSRTLSYSLTSTSNTSELQKSYNELAKNLLNRYTKLDGMSRRCYGHRLDDFILKCSFNSVTCDYSDFEYFLSKQYGNCFTFNRKTENNLNAKPRIVKRAGPQSGLELVLDVGLNSYSKVTPSFGVRVVIHNPQEDPHPSQKGVNIPFGVESHLSLAKTSFHRLTSPYRDDCKNYPPTGGLNCVDECIQRVSMKLCGCVDPFLMAALPKKVLCNLLNETQTACMGRVLDVLSSNVEERLHTCDCRLPCFSTEYDVQLQNMVMNRALVMRSVMSDRHFGKSYEPEECRGEKALMPPTKLKVFFQTLDHKIYVQKPMFSYSELYSQLGGNLSLWLGLSFVAMYEFAEKVFLFVKVALHMH
ncbi:hypothetical protein JTE90_016490 [Oedothorax gibbosus]|uniref:Uncharacterized protein n=1 Tax=Oedothorax gibbosus TaxID=931172 RepID=A0AAV6U8P2_9ARAC|nr:hypothetical protein JTE90_016490 [Oedothorax gibbosus]